MKHVIKASFSRLDQPDDDDIMSEDSTIMEEASVNESQIKVGDYNSVLWKHYQVDMHIQDLIS